MSLASRAAPAVVALACAGPCAAVDASGYLRPEYIEQTATGRGPLAAANGLVPGIVSLPRSGPEIDAELRATADGVTGVASLQATRQEGDRLRDRGRFDELYWSGDRGEWHFSAGKKIVAWDVGYAFRPNDVVEQEPRRLLLDTTPEGRPLLIAERFDARTAWSFVLVNPTHALSTRGAGEPAIAVRAYRHDGAVDWHGVARAGAHSGASVGAATAWVASESIEVHASARYLNAGDTLALDSAATAAAPAGLVGRDPWSAAAVRHAAQALVGGTWTSAEQVSLLAEAWWDGTALADGRWHDWNARNVQLAALIGGHAPVSAVAGNLAWQGNAFNASTSLRRANLYARASWQDDKWQPAVDIVFTPADAGRIVTASVGWQGDRARFDGGVRFYGGPSTAVLAQLPTRRIAYVAGTWSF
jgi:hypothetical protein